MKGNFLAESDDKTEIEIARGCVGEHVPKGGEHNSYLSNKVIHFIVFFLNTHNQFYHYITS